MSAFWKAVAAHERVKRAKAEQELKDAQMRDATALFAAALKECGADLAKPIHFDYDTETITQGEDHGRPA
jgi:hypothetical protein